MKVLVMPADDGGCGHYRLIWPAEAAAAAGLDVTVDDLHIEVTGRGRVDRYGRRPVTRVEVPDCDVIVVQRPLNIELVEAIACFQAAGIAVVVDVDDNFHALHARNVAGRSSHPALNPLENWNHLARACRAADLVTVTTPALAARYGAHGRVAVLPNLVPASLLDLAVARPERTAIGWTGTVATHPDDLQVTRGAVGQVVADHGVEFVCVGDGDLVARNLRLPWGPSITGWLPFDRYHRTVAERVTVGIVPLADTVFNAAKSGLKLLEFSALGIPAVVSPTPDNARLVADGMGVVARRPRDWQRALAAFAADPQLAADAGAAAREAARAHTIDENGWRWADAWVLAGTAVAETRRAS